MKCEEAASGNFIAVIRLLTISLFCLVWLAPVASFAQKGAFVYEHLTEKDGLMHAEVVQIRQDRFGLIWLGTLSGISCYDGAGFRHFLHDMNDPRSAPSPQANRLSLDADGNLCQVTPGAIARFCYESADFDRIPLDTAHWEYFIGQDLRIPGYGWCISKATGQLYALDGRNFRPAFGISDAQGRPIIYPQIFQVYSSRNGREIWLSDHQAVRLLRMQDSVAVHTTSFPLPAECIREGVRIAGLYKDTLRNRLWCFVQTFEKDRILIKDLQEGPFKPCTGFDAQIRKIDPRMNAGLDVSIDPQGKIWLRCNKGALIIFPDNRVEVLLHDPLNPQSMPNESLLTLFHDPFGNTWVGHSFGLSKIRLLPTDFEVIQPVTPQKPRKKSNKPDTIYGICEGDDGTIWTGATYYGLVGFSPGLHDRQTVFTPSGINKGFDNRGIAGLMTDHAGNIWIGTFYDGIYQYKPRQHRLARINPPPGSKRDAAYIVRGFLEMPDGKVWFARINGVSCIDPRNNHWQHYDFLFKNQNVVSGGQHVFGLCADPDGGIWAGYGSSALYCLRPGAPDFEKISFPFEFKVLSVFCDSLRQKLWVGTQGAGLGCFNLKTRQFDRFYGQKEGLTGSMVYGIVLDRKGVLWLSTNNGIFRFSPEAGFFTRFGTADGLPEDDLYSIGFCYSLRSGMVYFGSLNGLIAFHPDSIAQRGHLSAAKVPFVFTRVKASGKDLWAYCYGGHSNRQLVLAPGENSLELDFSTLDFVFPNKKNFRWRLEGLDQNWNSARQSGKVQYTQIRPGRYRFVAQLLDDSGQLVEGELALRIYAQPYWWQRSEVQVFAIVVIIILLVGLAIWQTRRMQLRRIAEAQLAALRSQLDPHFVFNSLIAIGGFVAQNDKAAAKDYLARFAGLFRRMLHYSGKNAISLEADLEFLREYISLQQERYPGKFEYQEEIIPPDLNTRDIQVPPLLIQPLIENAIEHGLSGAEINGGVLLLCIVQKSDRLEILIEDNGTGFEENAHKKPSGSHASKGINLLRERLHLHQQASGKLHSLTISPRTPPPGTQVVIHLPNP